MIGCNNKYSIWVPGLIFNSFKEITKALISITDCISIIDPDSDGIEPGNAYQLTNGRAFPAALDLADRFSQYHLV